MKKLITVASIMMLATTGAHADLYVGAKMEQKNIELSENDFSVNGTHVHTEDRTVFAPMLMLGYEYSDWLAVEAGYSRNDLRTWGEATNAKGKTDSFRLSSRADLYSLSARFTAPRIEHTNLRPFAKVGYFVTDIDGKYHNADQTLFLGDQREQAVIADGQSFSDYEGRFLQSVGILWDKADFPVDFGVEYTRYDSDFDSTSFFVTKSF